MGDICNLIESLEKERDVFRREVQKLRAAQAQEVGRVKRAFVEGAVWGKAHVTSAMGREVEEADRRLAEGNL